MASLETEIWNQISVGNTIAYSEAYRFYYKRFFNYGRKFTEDVQLLEDAVQEALLTIWDKRKIITSLEYPASYFYNAFRYQLFHKIKQFQKQNIEVSDDLESDFLAEQMSVNESVDTALQNRLKTALTTLTSKQREAIFLRFYEGLSYDEVAGILNITTKATYKIMSRALGNLKDAMRISSGIIFFY